jgi:serine/threonine protein kinase
MPLPSGFRLGPYEIVSAVGRGGMGEVYRATDTRLGRTVAIKVLAPHLAGDSEVRARFEREGRTISSLGHPNICTLFDIGRETPSSGEAVDYLVLEFLEGETLDARLARGPLPIDQALRFAIEMCDALDAAHRRGLTHRDLKPANVMITPGGSKLLDFGLAKPRTEIVSTPDANASGASATVAAQLTSPLTTQGTILGTIQYMAPEQIEGREADARTDVWAFGCVLYEMVTGTRAFEGATPASLMAAILERQPAPFKPTAAAVPPRLWDIIRTCLEKNPDDRWQSARDLARELRWSASPASQVTAEAPVALPTTISRRAWLVSGVAVIAAALLASAWTLARRPGEPAAAAGPPVIVLMDSTHPERVYDDQTRKAGGTNADDLTDLLRDLPVRLVKENTNASWHREYEVLQENPALIVAHRSCFYDATMLGEASREKAFIDLSWDKFETFAALAAQANPRTKVLAYSRGSWADEAARSRWVAGMEQRFPPMKGRIDALRVNLARPTFRNPETGVDIRQRIIAMLGFAAKDKG